MIRVLDWFISILILIVAFPVLLLSAILIKTIDRGEIIYSQHRRGYRGKKFKMYKLSTMRKESHDSDYKVSVLGGVLRKFRINEIPQLWNVINGEMSIVGPRPDIESTYLFCMDNIPYYHYRTNCLPGITGHAQVHFKYVDELNVSNFSERLSYDLFFVKNNSLYLYVITLMKTLGSVILMKGK
jgi:lipopolysaccharide/colanic/teichoic acid biosynthesis glycosyltransferase